MLKRWRLSRFSIIRLTLLRVSDSGHIQCASAVVLSWLNTGPFRGLYSLFKHPLPDLDRADDGLGSPVGT
jgi:hypothetical protein